MAAANAISPDGALYAFVVGNTVRIYDTGSFSTGYCLCRACASSQTIAGSCVRRQRQTQGSARATGPG